jgi:hypothetical protein
VVADALSVRVATGLDDAGPRMEELVITVALADNEIAVVVIASVLVNVMHLGGRWKPTSESLFSDKDVDGLDPAACVPANAIFTA